MAIRYSLGNRRGKRILSILSKYKNKTILDIGCATGYLGQILKKNKNYVVGVDVSRKAISQAVKVLDEAYVVDLNNISHILDKRKFDLIIATELVEHLFFPEQLLQNLVLDNLSKNGEILISTPNFLYYINRIKFILGKFRYENSGMFDRTHIHFMTYASLMDMIKLSKLKVLKEKPIIVPQLLSKIGEFFPSLFAYQFIILVKKA